MKLYRLVLVAIPTMWASLAVSDHPQVPTKSLPTATPPGTRRNEDAAAWLRYPPDDFYGSAQKIDEKDTYEVVASAKDLLVSPFGGLDEKAFSKVSPDDARRYTGHYYRCPKAKTPYLVRAAYGNSVWGQFEFEHVGRKLHIRHGSLGRSFQSFKTAFILNLDFEPEEVFISVSIAEWPLTMSGTCQPLP